MTVLRRRHPDAAAVTSVLWVGSAPTAAQAAQLVRDGVTAVIDLRAEAGHAANWPTQVVAERIPFVDHGKPSVGDVYSASQRATELLRDGHTLLLHCRAGLERAPTVACAILILQGWPLADAYRLVAARRRGAAPTDAQFAALRQLERDQLGHQP